MPAPFPQAKQGRPINSPPTGFPAFFDVRQPRVLTADPWAFLSELVATRVDRRQRDTGYSYTNQAWALFEAASNPHVGSRPLSKRSRRFRQRLSTYGGLWTCPRLTERAHQQDRGGRRCDDA